MKLPSTALLLALLASKGYTKVLEASIDAGTLQGGLCSNATSSQFLGVPYAIPPVGSLRWETPLKYNGTFEGGTRNATVYAPVCWQFGSGGATSDPGPYSEDCLYLDVWVPEGASNTTANLPVKVWIYGGSNTGGSIKNVQYNGCDLAQDGAIVVAIAYRLGPLGFLALDSAGIAGNFGIQDIILGLQWVQDNIAKFGGDKSKVLLFGQSAGAWDTWIVSTLPSAPSLMRGVALHSGAGVDFQTNASAQLAGSLYATTANCSVTDVSTIGACLRKKSPQQLNTILLSRGSPQLKGFTVINPTIEPFVDGKLIPVQPSEAGVQVPAVFSTTSAEGTSFVIDIVPSPENVTEGVLDTFLSHEFGPLIDKVLAQYPLSDFSSETFPEFYRASQIITDYAWKCPAYRGLLKAAEKGIPAWTYIFDHRASCIFANGFSTQAVALLGPTHAFDIPFFFAHTDDLPLPNGTCSLDSEEKQTSNTLVDSFTSLAANGNVSTSQFNWPTFTNQSYQGLYIGQNSTQVTSLLANYSICEFWDQINSLILTAAETNATNITAEIPTNPTITQTAIPTTSKPSEGMRALEAMGKLSIIVAVFVGYLLIDVI
ncbi:Cholinesterase [Dactylellina cionopaga]|nr:Cholinesterase [Dactylellina cionopaga]